VFTDGSNGLVSNAITGTGNVVMSASPTLSGTPIVSSLTDSVAVFSDGSKGLVSNAITGTGDVVMSASPTLTGTIGAAALTLSTPLVAGSGGTGLSAASTSGNVLTSNGSAWTSAVPGGNDFLQIEVMVN
jgi:hypothetical protein